ncbi:preprotein translocase subunit SecG [Candidatus Weimeria sp. HCP3S3_B5]|uniref:preprotein translocase subunit SecG n=1 Tax=Candidatus Weimeria sp. HCP3S3_B5 TaxID=3438871 RepID=UPI002A94F94A|nr:preprotein translocase subunit SecG [Lachnospiraceae bacterium]MDY6352771.1 preprotein translocase subunit SecG [Lachnospiraceae bacterium]
MTVLKYLFMVLFIIVSIVLTIIIMMQEGEDAGLGSLSGQSLDTYWSKNKGRSREGVIIKVTAVLVAVFFVLALLLNMSSFKI